MLSWKIAIKLIVSQTLEYLFCGFRFCYRYLSAPLYALLTLQGHTEQCPVTKFVKGAATNF